MTNVTELKPKLLGELEKPKSDLGWQNAVQDPVTKHWYLSQSVKTKLVGVELEHTQIVHYDEKLQLIDTMLDLHAGHGTAIAVQNVDGKTYIWHSWNKHDPKTAKLLGRNMARVRYSKGTKNWKNPDVQMINIFTKEYALPAITGDLLGLRLSAGGKEWVVVRRLSDVLAGKDEVLGQTPKVSTAPPNTPQGFTIDSKFIYRYTGGTKEDKLVWQYDYSGKQVGKLNLNGWPKGADKTEAEGLYVRPDGTLVAGIKAYEGTDKSFYLAALHPTEEANVAYSPKPIKNIFTYVNEKYPDVQNGGILANKSGYHNSRNNLKAVAKWRDDYSITDAPADLEGDGNAAAAVDLTPKKAETHHLLTKRFIAALKSDDPRAEPVRECFGSVDGKTVTGWSRLRGKAVTSEDSHLWHLHISFYRRYVDDEDRMLGVAELLCGVPLSESATKHRTGPASPSEPPTAPTPTAPKPTPTPAPKPAPKPVTSKPSPAGLYRKPDSRLVYLDKVKPGTMNSDSMYWVQVGLNSISFENGKEIPLTGDYDYATIAEAKKFQKYLGDKELDGFLGPKQTRELFQVAKMKITIEESSK